MSYFISREGQSFGPYSEAEIHAQIQAGQIALTDLAWREGETDWRPLGELLYPLTAEVEAHSSPTPSPAAVFHHVAPWKFVLLSLATFSFYDLYWVYRNWRFIKQHGDGDIWPFWRAFFSPLWMYPLAGRIRAAAGKPTALVAAVISVAYFLLSVSHKFPDPWSWLGAARFATLLPFVVVIDRLNRSRGARGDSYSRLNWWRWLVLAAGTAVWGVVAVSSFNVSTIRVVAGHELSAAQRRFLESRKVLLSGESPLFFYSGGFWSIATDGNLLTTQRVISYYEDEDSGELVIDSAQFGELVAVQVAYSESWVEDSVLQVEAEAGHEFTLILSAEEGGDRKFVEELEARWQAVKPDARVQVEKPER